MRTTLDIDPAILAAAKSLAAQRGLTLGQVISNLARQGLRPRDPSPRIRNGVPLLPIRPTALAPDLDLVNALRDGDE